VVGNDGISDLQRWEGLHRKQGKSCYSSADNWKWRFINSDYVTEIKLVIPNLPVINMFNIPIFLAIIVWYKIFVN